MTIKKMDIKQLRIAKNLIQKNLRYHYTIAQIASHAALSQTRLKKGFKEVYQVGLFEFLEIERLEKAKKNVGHYRVVCKPNSHGCGLSISQ